MTSPPSRSLWVTKDKGDILGLFVGFLACLLVYEFLFHDVHFENGFYEGRVFVFVARCVGLKPAANLMRLFIPLFQLTNKASCCRIHSWDFRVRVGILGGCLDEIIGC
jgi:hypothetical protein